MALLRPVDTTPPNPVDPVGVFGEQVLCISPLDASKAQIPSAESHYVALEGLGCRSSYLASMLDPKIGFL